MPRPVETSFLLSPRFEFCSVNSTKDGRKPASVLPPPVGAISRTERPCSAKTNKTSRSAHSAQPRDANQRWNTSGNSASFGAISTSAMSGVLPRDDDETRHRLALLVARRRGVQKHEVHAALRQRVAHMRLAMRIPQRVAQDDAVAVMRLDAEGDQRAGRHA